MVNITPTFRRVLVPALLAGGVFAGFEISCGTDVPSSRLEVFLRPFGSVIAHWLHSFCTRLGHDDFTHLEIQTWPSFANESPGVAQMTLYLRGFGYSAPSCARDPTNRYSLVYNLLQLLGSPLLFPPTTQILKALPPIAFETFFPAEYLSWSVSGAQVRLLQDGGAKNHSFKSDSLKIDSLKNASLKNASLKNASLKNASLKTITGRYGSFAGFETASTVVNGHSQSTDNGHPHIRLSVQLSGCKDEFVSSVTNVTAFLIPSRGVSIVADIDDILRVASIWDWAEAIQQTFIRPFAPWLNMPHWFGTFHSRNPDLHFHYVTDAPETSSQFYVDGVTRYYPIGTFDFRPIAFRTIDETLNPRYHCGKRLIESFPGRKFVLFGDTATGSTISAYSRLAREFPDQVQCIVMRDVNATEPANWITPNLAQLPRNKTMFFDVPDDLEPLSAYLRDLANGTAEECAQFGKAWPAEHGALAAWVLTLSRGVSAVVHCFLSCWEYRPCAQCPFDWPSLQRSRGRNSSSEPRPVGNGRA